MCSSRLFAGPVSEFEGVKQVEEFLEIDYVPFDPRLG